MSDYDAIRDLRLTVESESRERRERDTSSGFTRTTTVVSLSGAGETGRGEDVTYDTEDHDRLAAVGSRTPTGQFTFGEYSAALDETTLFPEPPERESAHHYRRWAYESAALDLLCRQHDTTLGELLGREPRPVRFVASARLSPAESDQPPTADRVHALRDRLPDVQCKLDPTSEWTDELVAELRATGAVVTLDLKGQYHGTLVDQEPDPALYERVIEGFPDAVIEDPAVTPETRDLLEPITDRLAWDAPITGVASCEALPFEPRWLNVKPSRFGTLQSLLETVEWAEARDVTLYGGGQFELDVGREQIQRLAALFYPDGPNDVAPGVFNDPELHDDLPASPLQPSDARGFRF
ncbi:MAG: hypothetical protein ABEI75_04375 [Halobaculum sp.]